MRQLLIPIVFLLLISCSSNNNIKRISENYCLSDIVPTVKYDNRKTPFSISSSEKIVVTFMGIWQDSLNLVLENTIVFDKFCDTKIVNRNNEVSYCYFTFNKSNNNRSVRLINITKKECFEFSLDNSYSFTRIYSYNNKYAVEYSNTPLMIM